MTDKNKRSTGFQERLKKGTVREAHDKKLKDKKKKEDKKKRVATSESLEHIGYEQGKKQLIDNMVKKAKEQNDYSIKSGSPIAEAMKSLEAEHKLTKMGLSSQSRTPLYTRPDKEYEMRKSGGYIKKYAKGGGVRKVQT